MIRALALVPLFVLPLLRQDEPSQDPAGDPDPRELLTATFAQEGLRLDLERGVVSLPARVLVKNDLLEYLLVGPRGATHESLFLTDVTPSVLNAALLTVGVTPGQNARWVEKEGEVDERGRPQYEVLPPEGDGFLIYVAWREGEESYLYRVDDLISNLATRRSLRRHRWVYLGSRFHKGKPDAPEVFVADQSQNLVNLSFFYTGDTLVTAALPECEEQTIWVGNTWILPERDQEVSLLFTRDVLASLPPDWDEELPVVQTPPADDPEDAR